jgi:Repeat of unknown function (DUF5907)
MSQPTAYFPTYNFTQFQASHPSTPLPAASLDAELFGISTSLTEVCTNLALIQRDDGALANQSVGYDQLKSGISIGLAVPATNWTTGTAYVKDAIVYQNNSIYSCLVSHTATVFAADLASGYWVVLINTGQYVNAAATSATQAATYAAALVDTSTTSLAIATGAKSFTCSAGKQFAVGQFMTAASASGPTNYMHGQVTSYSGTTLVLNVLDVGGSGTKNDWNLSISSPQGPNGSVGALTNTHIFVGSGSNIATDVAMSGDATMANTGALTITNSAVTLAKIANAAANSKLLGSGAAGAGAAYAELTLGTNLSMSGTTLNAAGGGVVSVKQQVFTSSGTYTPSTGMLYCIVESVDGGGGGGGVKVASAANVAVAGGGYGGAYGRTRLTAAQVGVSQTVTIGAGGTGGNSTGTSGSNGGTTSLGVLHVGSTGGTGGAGSTNATTTDIQGEFVSVIKYATADFTVAGGTPSNGLALASPLFCIGSTGGCSLWGPPTGTATRKVSGAFPGSGGSAASTPGAGGGGAASITTTTGAAGADGCAGRMLVTEFCSV